MSGRDVITVQLPVPSCTATEAQRRIDAASNGYYLLTTEILGVDRKLDVFFDHAPAERSVNYAGYLDVTKVVFNGVDITSALTPDDLKCIAEEIGS